VQPNPFKDGELPGARAEYIRALRLAEVLASGRGIAPRSIEGSVLLTSLLVDLETGFEKFLLDVLRRKLSPAIDVLDGNREGGGRLFEDSNEHTANPDIVLRRGADAAAVLDAKYRMKIDRDDINQMIAYGSSFSAKHGIVVRPYETPGERRLVRIGTVKGFTLSEYRFYLGAENLDQEEEALSNSIAGLVA
jgi:5-methylcytosine-specific restriction endonuclease McrBC regulatory subunit McrC